MEFQIGQIFEGKRPPEAAVWCNHNDCRLVQEGENYRIVKNEKPSLEEVLENYTSFIELYINAKAREKDYKNAEACVSYINSTNQTWKEEAIKFNEWRDRVWETWYKISNEFSPDMKLEELKNMLPKLEW
jgi:hypothetical protein